MGQALDDGFNPNANATVYALEVQPNEQVLMGGDFTIVGGQPRNRMARVNLSGSLDVSFNPNVNGRVVTMALQSDRKILLAGQFTQVGGQTRNRIARIHGDGSLDAQFNPGANGSVSVLVLQENGKILLGGEFTQVGGQPRNRIARLNPDGSLDASFNPNANGSILSIALQDDGKILLGGDFTQLSGQVRNRIARVDENGVLDANFNPTANGTVASIAVYPNLGTILVGGDFTRISGANAGRFAGLNEDGTLASAGSGAGVYINSILLSRSGGIFFAFNGTGYMAGITTNGTTFSPNPSFNVYAIRELKDGRVIIGGAFTKVGTFPVVMNRSHIALLNPSGVVDMGFNAVPGSIVQAIALQADHRILVGGTFLDFLGTETTTPIPRPFVARLKDSGDLDGSLTITPDFYITALLAQPDGKIVLGGAFSQINGSLRQGLVRLRPDGTVESAIPTIAGLVTALAIQSDGKLLLGGSFSSVGGQSFAARIARLFPDGTLDSLFNPGIGPGTVNALVVQPDGRILVGGEFSQVGGQPHRDLVRLLEDGAIDPEFSPKLSGGGAVTALAIQSDGRVLLGGSFGEIAGQEQIRLARLESDGSLDPNFTLPLSDTVFALSLQSDQRLLVGGDFRGGLTRLTSEGVPDETFAAITAEGIRTLALDSGGRLLVGGIMLTVGDQSRPFMARISNTETANQTLAASPDRRSLSWTLSPTSPLPAFAFFQSSLDGVNWDDLGPAAKTATAWEIDGISLPSNTEFIRARGVIPHSGRGASLLETVVSLGGVPVAPLITTPPLDQTVMVGDTASLIVSTSGVDPWFQWQRDGLNLSDGTNVLGSATSGLSVERVNLWDAGEYSVVAENALGQVISPVASLTVALAPGSFATLAGQTGGFGGNDYANGRGNQARFGTPRGIAVDTEGNVFVADGGNHTIRRISRFGVATTVAGASGSFGNADGTTGVARFRGPSGLALAGDGTLYVADAGNHTIRKISPAGFVTTWAGSAGLAGSTDGTGSVARFRSPADLAIGIGGDVYVVDEGNHTLRRITSDGEVTTLAGMPGRSDSADGAGGEARFRNPAGIALDSLGFIYVADTGNNTVRKITSDGTVTTLAGRALSPGTVDGIGAAARFQAPTGIEADTAGNIYVTDLGSHIIRRISPEGVVVTLAGSPGSQGSADGIGDSVRFSSPHGVAVDAFGHLYVADSFNHTIRKGRVDGINLPPASTGLFLSAIQNQTLRLTIGQLLNSVRDPEGSPLVLMSVASSSVRGGQVSRVGDIVTYAPPPGYAGPDQIQFVVQDNLGTQHSVVAPLQLEIPPRMIGSPEIQPGVVGFTFTGDERINDWIVERAESMSGPWTEVGSIQPPRRRGARNSRGGSFLDTSPPAKDAFYRTVRQ